MYRTKSIEPEQRNKIPNGTGPFDICEDCKNLNYEEETMIITYYSRYKKALCDSCVDCRDGNKWKNKTNYSFGQ